MSDLIPSKGDPSRLIRQAAAFQAFPSCENSPTIEQPVDAIEQETMSNASSNEEPSRTRSLSEESSDRKSSRTDSPNESSSTKKQQHDNLSAEEDPEEAQLSKKKRAPFHSKKSHRIDKANRRLKSASPIRQRTRDRKRADGEKDQLARATREMAEDDREAVGLKRKRESYNFDQE
ncbi:hypothetical protein CKM354_000743200 [Cercospora kikuchii]|uniref:Uncharacterized protein n=1 Tax=Cercospora kikuchii TaxID=84275 RepID=A0A9P3CK44_9PEZI|nr:uncharacterized protein CKM354_000743200 [Cercospora kikuchii]GIZ44228.1 hypothetical protein CKM354_000743200 [Cercospora kikuchii]